MRFVKRAAIGLLVAMGVQSPVMASDWGADLPEARLSWNLGFGGDAGIRGGYGFGLAYRVHGLEEPATVVAFEVANRVVQARLAGVPVFERTYSESAAEDFPEVIEEETPEAGAESSSPSWGWWAAGAAVALAVAASASASAEEGEGEGDDFENPGTTGVTQNDDGTWVGCVNGTCAVCPEGDVAEACGDTYVATIRRGSAAGDLERQRRLDAGTGGMGDLLPLQR